MRATKWVFWIHAVIGLVASRAQAGVSFSPEAVTPVIWLTQQYTAGQVVTVETKNLTPSIPTGTADTVIHVIDGYDRSQVGYDDDSGGNRSSRATFTAAHTGYYKILVHGYSSSSNGGRIWSSTEPPFCSRISSAAFVMI